MRAREMPTLPRAFSITFSALKRWDPNSFHNIKWHWPESVMSPIGSILSPRKERVDRSENDFATLMPVTIHFNGSIEPRKVNQEREYTMDLFWARPGDIVVSKIDLKNGAVAIIPNGWDNIVVTNHFAVYKPDLAKVEPKYFHLLIQAKFFKDHLWRNKVGAEGRKEGKLDFFEALEVPIPPPHIQHTIVKHWKDSIEYLAAAQSSIEGNQAQLSNDILRSSSIEISMGKPLTKIFTTTFGSIERWGVGFNRHPWTLQNLIKSGKYQSAPLDEYADINPGVDLKLNDDDMVSFIPMNAVDDKDGRIAKNDSKKLREVRTGYTRFQEGDVIWAKITPCMQNGKSAIARNLTNGIGFGSTEFHVIRSRDTGLLTNEFIHLLLRLREIRIAATGYFVGSAGQQRVPKEFLEELHIPIPPLNIQTELVTRVTEARFEIGKIRERMHLQRKNALREVEQMILGVRPVEEI